MCVCGIYVVHGVIPDLEIWCHQDSEGRRCMHIRCFWCIQHAAHCINSLTQPQVNTAMSHGVRRVR